MKLTVIYIIALLSIVSCSKDDNDHSATNNKIEEISENGISNTMPSSISKIYSKSNNFNKYTYVNSPNGKHIHIVAQNMVTEEQVLRCKNILKHYLKNYDGSLYGSDKSSVANKMAENNAILCLLNGEDDGTNPMSERVTGQSLFQNEIQIEGGEWYMNQNYEHRDASFEEILHFVHDNGIGVDTNGKASKNGAAPEFQNLIRQAQKNALDNKIWGFNQDSWISELSKENSLSQEYLAAVIDSYYGLWSAWDEDKDNGMWGFYLAKSRYDMKTDDPIGYELMNKKFFHPYLTYNARISAKLNGNFSLKFDKNKLYTNHSRYLKDVTLLGLNNNSVTVNELNNDITGNSGENTVVFSGNSDEYNIQSAEVTTVTDTKPNRDGTNRLRNIEFLQFKDKKIKIH
ncbi:MAG: hypothetical protein N4A49_10235 [Marinifilaceae bacterium]|nr:hypothetical protein [Marinifilaceae bacterium]